MNKLIILSIFFAANLNALNIKIGTGGSIPDSFLNKYYSTSINFNTAILFNTRIKYIKIGAGYQYNKFNNSNSSFSINNMTINVKIGNFFSFFITPYIKIGAGIIFENLRIQNKNYRNYDPVFQGGFGINILKKHLFYIESSYCFIFQKSQLDAKTNAGMLNINLGASFKL